LFNWLGNWFKFLNGRLSLNKSDFDVELNAASCGQGNSVGKLEVRVIFDLDSFVFGVEVDDVELADFGDSAFVDQLSALVVEVLEGLDCWDAFERSLVVDFEGQFDVQVDHLRLVHFWLIARGNKVFLVNLKVIN